MRAEWRPLSPGGPCAHSGHISVFMLLEYKVDASDDENDNGFAHDGDHDYKADCERSTLAWDSRSQPE